MIPENVNLHLSKNGAALIHSFESCKLKAYIDTYDRNGNIIWSIGWGHSNALGNPSVYEGMTITQEQADAIFLNDVKIFEDKVKKLVTVPLNQNQFDALVSMAYNVATANFKKMLADSGLNEGVYHKVPEAMMQFNKSAGRVLKGLTRRRTMEGQLFMKPVTV